MILDAWGNKTSGLFLAAGSVARRDLGVPQRFES
jgi:hypothetical protein